MKRREFLKGSLLTLPALAAVAGIPQVTEAGTVVPSPQKEVQRATSSHLNTITDYERHPIIQFWSRTHPWEVVLLSDQERRFHWIEAADTFEQISGPPFTKADLNQPTHWLFNEQRQPSDDEFDGQYVMSDE